MPDERLKAAVEEIKAVLDKHDVCGIIILGGQQRLEHFTKFHASWSCASYDGEMVQFKAGIENFPTVEAQKECVETTVGIVVGFADACRMLQEQLEKILVHLSKYYRISHRSREL